MTDERLVLAFLAGERPAFDELFQRYRQPIWAFFRRRTPDPADAEELAQETFLALLQSSRRYEPRASFRSYLFGIAFNVLSAWRRKARLSVPPDARANADTVPAAPEDPASSMWVRDALDALDPGDREILMLREYDALSYVEIAGLLRIPVNTVRSRLFRARLALKERLVGQPQHTGGRP